MSGSADLDWLTPLAARGPVPGLRSELTVTCAVPKTADGDQSFTAVFTPEPDHAGGEPDAVELTAKPEVAEAIARGEVVANVAWMSGRLKAVGPTGPLLALLAHAEQVAQG